MYFTSDLMSKSRGTSSQVFTVIYHEPGTSHLDNTGFVSFQNLQGLSRVGIHHEHEGMASICNQTLPAPGRAQSIINKENRTKALHIRNEGLFW